MKKKIQKKSFLNRNYKSFIKNKQGQKLVSIFKFLAENLATREEIRLHTQFSTSEIRNLLTLAEENDLVYLFSPESSSRPRGRPSQGNRIETGRQPAVYSLTWKSRVLIRSDHKLENKWSCIEEKNFKIEDMNAFDSYSNLKYSIKKHSALGKIEKPYYFDGILQRTLLNPLLFERNLDDEHFDKLSNELVNLMIQNVKNRYVKSYTDSLENSVGRLEVILKRHRILIKKLKLVEDNSPVSY